jgi:AhpD family alkylhydroperoxidase
MALTFKERELANIGASVATGCKPCTDYDFNKVREAGASDEEVKEAISKALEVREKAKGIMESHGLKHLGIKLDSDYSPDLEGTTRIQELVSIASAFAVNCTTSVEKHIFAARTVGISEKEIESILGAAQFIKGEAAHYVGQMVKLEKEKDQLQELLEELERTQAQLVQSEKMAALGKLVAGVVHEMNSPLSAINSSADNMNRSINHIFGELERNSALDTMDRNGKFSKYVKVLRDNAQNMLIASERITTVVTNFKAFAHLDNAEYEKTDLQESLENILNLLDQSLGERIKVIREYGNTPLVFCSPRDINQVFLNLLTNASEAIQEKGSITIRTFEKNGDVYVQIVDNGIGISGKKLVNLFDPSFTTNGTRMKAGLGLFICTDIMQKHQGRIEVESEVGKGSTFSVIFSLQETPPNETGDSSEEADRCSRLDQ